MPVRYIVPDSRQETASVVQTSSLKEDVCSVIQAGSAADVNLSCCWNVLSLAGAVDGDYEGSSVAVVCLSTPIL